MTTFDSFKLGERVAHISMGDGTVDRVTDEYVHVAYDRGLRFCGMYDRRWFELHPGYLFHRSPR